MVITNPMMDFDINCWISPKSLTEVILKAGLCMFGSMACMQEATFNERQIAPCSHKSYFSLKH